MNGFDLERFIAGIPAINRNGEIVEFSHQRAGAYSLESQCGQVYACDGRWCIGEDGDDDFDDAIDAMREGDAE